MTWPEIKEALVRRWPDMFKHGDGDYIESVRNTLMYYHPSNLADISAICKAVGAVVWSVPAWVDDGSRSGWDGGYSVGEEGAEEINWIGKAFDSRESAELAALGEWLRATEVDHG